MHSSAQSLTMSRAKNSWICVTTEVLTVFKTCYQLEYYLHVYQHKLLVSNSNTYSIEVIVEQLRQALQHIKGNWLKHGHHLHVITCTAMTPKLKKLSVVDGSTLTTSKFQQRKIYSLRKSSLLAFRRRAVSYHRIEARWEWCWPAVGPSGCWWTSVDELQLVEL